MTQKILTGLLISLLAPCLVLASGTATPSDSAPTIKATLTMYPQFMAGDFFARNWMKTMPHELKLSETRPEGIIKEPQYKGKPLYGLLRFGDDDVAPAVWVVLDDDANCVFIDSNQNNDLSDDPALPWDKVVKDGDKTSFEGNFVFPAHWKTGPGKYGIKLYRPKGAMSGWWQTISAPTGVLTVDGSQYIVYLYDRGGKGLFNTKIEADKNPGTSIFIDTNQDGSWKPLNHVEDTLIGEPFEIAGKWYSFDVSADGRELTGRVTQPPPPVPESEKIVMKRAGEKAPDFEMLMPDGSKAHLSDYKGKVVVLDMWATWCGPCQAAMPALQKVWTAAHAASDQVAFVGLCVSDEKDSFDKWVAQKKGTYTFTFGFDPAGNTDKEKSQCRAWGVSGIPATFVIDANGMIAETMTGYTPENEEKLSAALQKLGIKLAGK